jgi:hypothetical protein
MPMGDFRVMGVSYYYESSCRPDAFELLLEAEGVRHARPRGTLLARACLKRLIDRFALHSGKKNHHGRNIKTVWLIDLPKKEVA